MGPLPRLGRGCLSSTPEASNDLLHHHQANEDHCACASLGVLGVFPQKEQQMSFFICEVIRSADQRVIFRAMNYIDLS